MKGKALSIRQPWAWLIVNGYKDIENRTWERDFKGYVFVHTGQKIDKEAIQWVEENFPDISLPACFDTGGIVGTVKIVDCVSESESPWFFGPYGFVIEKAEPCEFIPLKGQLGFFGVSVDEYKAIDRVSIGSSARVARIVKEA